MHVLRPSHLVVAIAMIVGLTAATLPTSSARPAVAPRADRVAEAHRIARIRAHFDSVLTELAEAARIQVPYVQPETPAQKARNGAFLVVAPVAVRSAIVTTALNARGNADDAAVAAMIDAQDGGRAGMMLSVRY